MKTTALTFFKWLMILSFIFPKISLAATNDPVNLLNSIAQQMISNLQAHRDTLKANPQYAYSLAYKIVVPNADITEMSKRVLPPHIWRGATESQKGQFQREFTALLVRTYATALVEYKDENVRFYPVRGGYQGKSNINVNSEIVRSDGPSIPVNYRLILRGNRWKLYDMSVDGVSLLESFRSQFADLLSSGNMDELLKRLSQHNAGAG